ncbi:hypothetical protein F52700_918 [Fusarium sp. NRRL 52700]|nr:hypothetical protein F52700_918 [Fusarium sp. NRRL 52700]
MNESQIRPLSESHPDIYRRLLDQFDLTIAHLNYPIRVCGRSLENILLRLQGNGINDSIIRFHVEGSRNYLSRGGEDEHLHPFCYLECSSLEYRPVPRFYPRYQHRRWGTGGWPVEHTWLDYLRRRILPELIDLSDDAGKNTRVGALKHAPLASPWPREEYDAVNPLPPASIELYISHLEPFQLEECYSLHYIKLRKFSGDHNMGHEEAHREAYKRTSERFWERINRVVGKEYMQLTLTRRGEAITACSKPTPDSESESEDGMDIDDEDVAWSPVDEMSGLEVDDEPQGLLQRPTKRLFDDDDEADHDVTTKRARVRRS